MITKDSIETAFSFFHQKLRVYEYSTLEWQKDDIEYAIASYVDDMSQELYEHMAGSNKQAYLKEHSNFLEDLQNAVTQLDNMRGRN